MSEAPILKGINRVADIAAASDFENKHTPSVECARVDDRVRVSVKMGHGVPHPNEAGHFIEWIDVLVNDVPVERCSFAAVASDPVAECLLNIDAGDKITAVASCNLHGLWAWDVKAP